MSRHPFDSVSLEAGIFFAVIGLLLLTGTADAISIEWAGPVVVIVLGVLILIGARARPDQDAPPEA